MFWALDLVKNRSTKEPFDLPQDKAARRSLVVDAVVAEMMKRKVSVMGWVSHLVIAPPLIITEEEIDEAIAALDGALAIADAKTTA
jgi:taurine--2-oxoglutarate transaminase